MKTITIHIPDEDYDFILQFREYALKTGKPISTDEIAEMAFKNLRHSFVAFMKEKLHTGEA